MVLDLLVLGVIFSKDLNRFMVWWKCCGQLSRYYPATACLVSPFLNSLSLCCLVSPLPVPSKSRLSLALQSPGVPRWPLVVSSQDGSFLTWHPYITTTSYPAGVGSHSRPQMYCLHYKLPYFTVYLTRRTLRWSWTINVASLWSNPKWSHYS